jgi:hypothetical protein
MLTKKSILRMLSVLFVILMISGAASASPQLAPNGTGFTYQGKLIDGGVPANGAYDLNFNLFDALSSGSQVGSTIAKRSEIVSNGLFTVQLDFGNVFNGTALYLEISVRLSSIGGAFTTLTPRQPMSPTPYALFASNSALLSSQPASYYLNASNINSGSLGTNFFSAYADLGAEGYLGNGAGDLALNNGTLQATLNADLLDGYHAGNASGNIPIDNGTLNTNLNADQLDGQHGTYYQNASNINSGTLSTNYFSAYTDLVVESKIGTGSGHVAAGDHNHWGQTWSGSGTGLTLSGGSIGLSVSGSDIGVFGNTTGINGLGVYGTSTTGIGVSGFSTDGAGLSGLSGNGDGVVGFSVSAIGVKGDGDIGVAGSSTGTNGIGVYGAAHGGTGDYAGLFAGNVYVFGNQTVSGTKSAVVKTQDYGTRALYSVESPEVWFEDFGTAQLVEGAVTVTFEPIFAQTVALTDTYHVLVTPLCDTPVLVFVTQKTPTGFTVRGVTIDNQPSQCTFDYRIAAKRLGYEDIRLAEVTDTEPLLPPEGGAK